MTLITPEPLTRSGKLALTAPERVSFIVYDVEASHHFYHDVLQLPLVFAQTSDYLPGSDVYEPHIEVRYALRDGSTINLLNFREGAPDSMRRLHPLRHFAFEAGSVENLHRWKARLVDQGIDVLGEIDHEVIMSIYFHDPNEIRLELTTNLVKFGDKEAREAQEIYDNWWRLGAAEQHTPPQGYKLQAGRGSASD